MTGYYWIMRPVAVPEEPFAAIVVLGTQCGLFYELITRTTPSETRWRRSAGSTFRDHQFISVDAALGEASRLTDSLADDYKPVTSGPVGFEVVAPQRDFLDTWNWWGVGNNPLPERSP